MLWTIFAILLVMWALGMVSSYTLGGYIHIILVVAIVVALIELIRGGRGRGLAGVLFLTLLTAGAKDALGAETTAAIQGGLSAASISTPSEFTSSARAGFAVGVNAEIPLGDIIYLQPEVAFVQRGSQIVNGQGVNLRATHNTIEVPILFKLKFGEKVAPYIFAGPNTIFNISSNLDAEVGGQSGSVSFNPRTVDLALDVGGGVDFGSVFANLRYTMTFIDWNENQAHWNSRGFQLLIGFKFI